MCLLGVSSCLTPGLSKPQLTTSLVAERKSGEAVQLSLTGWPGNQPWKLADEHGNVVLLDVWATWCDPCRDSLPLYADIAKQYEGRPLKVYAINVDAEAALIAPFLKEHKIELPVLLDPEARASEAVLRVKVMPTTFLIGKDGTLRHAHEGFDEAQFSVLLEQVDALLAEEAKPKR